MKPRRAAIASEKLPPSKAELAYALQEFNQEQAQLARGEATRLGRERVKLAVRERANAARTTESSL